MSDNDGDDNATGSDGRERKERVIHTRVPESLDEEIRTRAAKLGISVSNLVRNVLRNAFDLVEDVIVDTATVARHARREEVPPVAATPPRSPAGRTLGWQKLLLQINAVCSLCNDVLPRGSEAALAVIPGAGTDELICMKCLDEVTR